MVYSKDNPFQARLKYRARITGNGSEKDVRHMVFDIGGSGIAYKCGDSVAILPKNNTATVAEILNILKTQPDVQVKLPNPEKKTSIFSALCEHLCVMNLSHGFLEWFTELVTDSDEISYINDKMLCDGQECKMAAKAYSLLEILKKFKNLRPVDANALVANLNKLTPRLYSIASSPMMHRDEIHIVVNVVSYINFAGNERHGVASTYLAQDMNVGIDSANIFVINSTFALPTNSEAKIVMIGPGTGIAPFRGFLQERQCLRASGKKIGDSWLFFGDRNRATDFLFRDELLNFKNSGVLTNLDLAFSRDQGKKIYVQDRIWENREELWSWILDDAYIYVCGNASNMAADVDKTLKNIAIEVGNFDETKADEFFKSLKKNKHYQRDVY
ncbi:MAG: hypothetical protein LBR91_00880 [Puniceicoccales bacterium]|jgi:sulfite reductase (NADPH) flavoprotein alpha-component|nr:hypothetical protein [Puniceicoccales bacterium]